MRMEYSNYQELTSKLKSLLYTMGLRFELSTGDPITMTITPEENNQDQLSMIDEDCVPVDSRIVFEFQDGEMYMSIFGAMQISDAMLNKVRGLCKKLHYAYLQWYFVYNTCRDMAARNPQEMPSREEEQDK